MQDVSPTRLPPIDIHVKKLAREPPEKSWPKFKKVLIDYPRDRNLVYRQKLWDFQKLNRGAFRSHVSSLPEIPYRVNTNKPETASVGIQSDMRMLHQSGLKLILPRIRETIQRALDKVDSAFDSENSGINSMHPVYNGIVNYVDSDIEDPGFEFDSVKRRKNAGTMTDPAAKKVVANRKNKTLRRKKILKDKVVTPTERPSPRKIVKFAEEGNEKEDDKEVDADLEWLEGIDIEEQEKMYLEEELEPEELEEEEEEDVKEEGKEEKEPPPIDKVVIGKIETRTSSASSSSSDSRLSLDAGNVGPSSQRSLDPLSVLDFLSGSRVGDARVMNREGGTNGNSKNDFEETPRRTKLKETRASEEDRQWYQKIVGDKDIVDLTNYESFARTRPTNESFSDSNNDRYVDLSKSSSRRSNNYTPRINAEFGKSQSRTGIYNPGFSKESTPTRKQGDTPNKNRSTSRRTMISNGKFY